MVRAFRRRDNSVWQFRKQRDLLATKGHEGNTKKRKSRGRWNHRFRPDADHARTPPPTAGVAASASTGAQDSPSTRTDPVLVGLHRRGCTTLSANGSTSGRTRTGVVNFSGGPPSRG